MITEAEKSQDLQAAPCKPRGAHGIVQSKLEGLRTGKAWSVSSSPKPTGLRPKKIHYFSSSPKAVKVELPLTQPFVFFPRQAIS